MRFQRRTMVGIVICLVVALSGTTAQATAQSDVRTDLFQFHSGFWINLHHFLYREAQLSEGRRGPHQVSIMEVDTEQLQRLTPQERTIWNEALSYYSSAVVKRDLLFDEELIQTKDHLEDAEASPDLATVAIPAELKTALLKAAPIYRRHWWLRHDRNNRDWINHLAPLVAQHGSVLSERMSRIYDESWPPYSVRIDTVAYANWAGAYTTLEPTRPTISTTDPANQGAAALEIVFHETSHGMMGKVMNGMHTAETALNAQRKGTAYRSGSVWHAILFYTAGELVAEQIPGYTPYADKNGLWVRAWPDPNRELIERDWRPHMNGSVSLQQSLTKLVVDLAAAPPGRPD